MNKKIVSAILALMLCFGFVFTVQAAPAETCLIYDEAELLSDADEQMLNRKLNQISMTHQAQLVICTVDAMEDGINIDDYLHIVYDSMEFGYGEKRDGVLLLVCMDPREYRILSNGFAGDAIDSGTIEVIGDAFVSDLSDGNYMSAFTTFAYQCDYYLNGYINGFPFDAGMSLAISVGVGLVIALIVTGIWKGQLKSVQMQRAANVYVKAGSLQITNANDLFLYSRVSKTEKEKKSSSGGSSRSTGGGSF